MNENSPHLPERDIEKENKSIKNILWLLLVVFLSSLTAIASTLAVEAWILPFSLDNRTSISIENRGGGNNEQPQISQLQKNQINQRLVSIYNSQDKIEDQYYPINSKLATGVLLSSNGWVAFHNPKFDINNHQILEVIDHKGIVHKAKKIKYDQRSGITYIQLNQDNFRVSSIFEWESKEPKHVWRVGDKNWYMDSLVERKDLSAKTTFSIAKPQFFYQLDEYKTSQALFSNNGALVGFVDQEGKVLPSWYISNQLSNVLSNNQLSYPELNYSGRLVDVIVDNEDNSAKELTAFYVESDNKSSNTSTVMTGDLILSIDNNKIDSENISRLYLTSSDSSKATVIRKREQLEVEI